MSSVACIFYAMLNFMRATILSGRTTREALVPRLKAEIDALSFVPQLVIIQVGDRADSTAFIQAKKSFAKEIGVKEKHIQLPITITQEEIGSLVEEYNKDMSVQGIILQLPLPAHLDSGALIEKIAPHKDVDGLTSYNIQALNEGREGVMPATARGIKEFFIFNKIELKGKKVTVVGRSPLVGAPIALMCKAVGAEVVVAHSKTVDLITETQSADILIVAVGKPMLIGTSHVHAGQVVIDVGINRNGEEKLVGDVDFDAVKEIVAFISPVPGGVGPMTVYALFQNMIDLCRANRYH